MGKNVIQDYERGSKTKGGERIGNNPKLSTLYAIADGLGVHPSELLPR